LKLIYCPHCNDIVKLRGEAWRACYCGKSRGVYAEDDWHATISGAAIPVGVANFSFYEALRCQPEAGQGERFTAFVIPKSCPTIEVLP
jgi:hypothetical protein